MIRGRRYAAAALVVALGHLLVIYGFSLTGGGGADSANQTLINVSLIDGPLTLAPPTAAAAPPQPTPPAPPAQPATPPTETAGEADPILDLTKALIRADVAAAPTDPDPAPTAPSAPSSMTAADPALNSGGANCELTETLQAALQADPAVLDSTRRMPRKAKSVANAVKIWDAQWATVDDLGDVSVLAPIQAAVLATLHDGAPACIHQTLMGPRLLMIADGGQTTLLAFGSGQWRWADLQGPDNPLSAIFQTVIQLGVRAKD